MRSGFPNTMQCLGLNMFRYSRGELVWCAIARYFPTLSSRCQNVPCPGVKDRPGHICPEDPPPMSALPLEVSLSHMDLPPDFQRYEAEQLSISYLTRNESRKCQLSLHASFSSNAIHSLRWFCLLINQLTYSRGLGLNVFTFYGGAPCQIHLPCGV